MRNVIAVWGNSGAGKSLVSCALANALTAKGKSVIVLSTDKLAPMLPVFLPMLEAAPEQSLGRLLSGTISEERLRNVIHIHPKNSNLGFMSLSGGENGLNYQVGWSADTLQQLTQLLFSRDLVDYLLFDCTPDVLNDSATLFALSKADRVVQVLSPDTRGISFIRSQMTILRGGSFNTEHITVLNNAHEYSPTRQLQKDYGMRYVLPHSRAAYSKFVGGELVKGLSGEVVGKQFEKTIKEIGREATNTNG